MRRTLRKFPEMQLFGTPVQIHFARQLMGQLACQRAASDQRLRKSGRCAPRRQRTCAGKVVYHACVSPPKTRHLVDC